MSTLAFRYTLFAVVATLINLGSQYLSLELYEGFGALSVAIVVGTAMGLVAKYWLDKQFIFFDDTAGVAAQSQQFALYTLMGVVTTLIFWGTEWSFHLLLATDWAKYLGATLGLAVGYVVKYQLDKRYVFKALA